MNAHDEGSSVMAEDSNQNHANHTNKQSQLLFQPGSLSKRNNDHLLNINSPNNNQRRKRKQPRSLPRQLQQLQQSSNHQISQNDKQKQHDNNNDDLPKITEQSNTNINNNWKYNFEENRTKINAESNMKQIPTPSFGKFFESLTANNSPKQKDTKHNTDANIKHDNNNNNNNDNKYNIMDHSNDDDEEENTHSQITISNIMRSPMNNNRAPFIEVFDDHSKQKVIDLYTEQLSGIFDELDLEICQTQQNILNHESESSTTSPIMIKYKESKVDDMESESYDDDYKQEELQPQSSHKKKQQYRETMRHSPVTPYRQKTKSKYKHNDDASSASNHNEIKNIYVHANGQKISDESFKLMQRCLNGLEKAKYIANQSNTMQELSQIQQNIYQTMKMNNSEEKMSVDGTSTSPSIQSAQQQYIQNTVSNKHSKQYRHRHKATPRSHKSREKNSKYNAYYNQTHIDKVDNNNTITNNINFISNHVNNDKSNHHLRRQLSFCSSANDGTDTLQYKHLSSPQIIAKQHQKLVRTNQEINDLQHELNCVYTTLDAVQKNRNKLFEDIKSIRAEHTEQIKSIMRQYTQFKQQTNLYQKEKKEIEYDLQQSKYHDKQEQPLSSIEVSPAKIPSKTHRKHHYQYKR